MVDRTSPLDAVHRELGARMVPFGGWDMPLSYEGGTLAEHRACRQRAVVFDVSHLGSVRVEGAGTVEGLQRALTNDLTKVAPGRAQYTHLLDPADASVTDDIIVWWREPDAFDVMPNASNTAGVLAALADEGLDGVDVTADRALLAVQGPEARRRIKQVSTELAAVGRFRVAGVSWEGVPLIVAGTGYTGEDGVEISVPADHAEALWSAIVATGVEPAGLGARDTLRLEAALPLHGHELGPGITPLQARLGWVVGWDKGPFRGREPLEAERERGPHRLLFGVATEGRRPPREGSDVLMGGEAVGTVTSGNFSPQLEHGIALAFLSPGTREGSGVEVVVRDSALPGRIVPIPFVTKR